MPVRSCHGEFHFPDWHLLFPISETRWAALAHQMVICPTSQRCCNPESLQPKAASSIHAARHFLPTTLPNGSSQSHGLPRQTGSSICSSFWQRDISLSGSTSWLRRYHLARRMIWPLSTARPGLLEPFRACACVPRPTLEHSI